MKITDIPDTGTIWAACSCGQPVLVVDRYITDRPPIPPVTIIEFYSDAGGDPDTRLIECPRCDEWLDLEATIKDPQTPEEELALLQSNPDAYWAWYERTHESD